MFRVRSSRGWEFGSRGLLWGGLLALLAAVRFESLLLSLLALLGSGAVGLLAGRRVRRFVCSTPNCDTILEPFMAQCPRCLGDIRGEINHPDERLAAEEALPPRRP